MNNIPVHSYVPFIRKLYNSIGIGSPCQNSTVCQYQIPNSYCANVQGGFGTCQCQVLGVSYSYVAWGTATSPGTAPVMVTVNPTQTTVPNLLGSQCVPQFCPAVLPVPNVFASPTPIFYGIQACQGDQLPVPDPTTGILPAPGTALPLPTPANVPYVCTNTSRGYQCDCVGGAKGRSHNATTIGRCKLLILLYAAFDEYSPSYTHAGVLRGLGDPLYGSAHWFIVSFIFSNVLSSSRLWQIASGVLGLQQMPADQPTLRRDRWL